MFAGPPLVSARTLQQAHAGYTLKRQLLAKSLPLLDEKEAEELAKLTNDGSKPQVAMEMAADGQPRFGQPKPQEN